MPTRTEAPPLRTTLRRLPSPVVVVTTYAEGKPWGITIGSFTSVSLDPPLVSFNVDRKAQSHKALHEAGRCAIHLLDDTQV
ncbi:MAG: flavin reductase family protein, partial [Longimonas sp.]|uniref:flavin reductase family protein n=1 Tax=Longimonas sp. TaxID=2039626 RepID=UPI00397505B8